MGGKLSTPFSHAENVAYFTRMATPMNAVGFVVCTIALILFYIFPKQRKFPNSVMAWTTICNSIYMLEGAIKWDPLAPNYEYTALHLGSYPTLCKASLYFDQVVTQAIVMCEALIILTLFLSIVMQRKVSGRKYIVGYLIALFTYPFLLSAAAIAKQTSDSGGMCHTANKSLALVVLIPPLTLLAVQLILLMPTLVYMRKVSRAAQQYKAKQDVRLTIFFYRMIAIYFLELVGVVFYITSQFYPFLPTTTPPRIITMLLGIRPACYLLEGIVLTATNRSLIQWCKRRFGKHKVTSHETEMPSKKLSAAASSEPGNTFDV